MFTKIRFPAVGLAILTLVPLLLTTGPVFAQEQDADTMRVLDRAIRPGDTAAVFIYLANSERLGGYTLRLVYDSSTLGVVTVSENDSTVEAVQLRGDFMMFAFGANEPEVVTGAAAFSQTNGLEAGSGNTARMRFYAKEYAPSGVTTQIAFVDHPSYPQSWNWFSSSDGLSTYQPVLIHGTVYVGCQCPNYGDYTGDGEISAQDVVFIVNRVYLGYGYPELPSATCPVDNGDWNCDGEVNPIDVVGYVNFVYQSIGSGPCDPCAE